MKIEVSNGEIVDKLTIIELKLDKIKDEEKLVNLKKEYSILNKAVKTIINKDSTLYIQLLNINSQLWDVEDEIRVLEGLKRFDEHFSSIARKVYKLNDKRSEIKRKINQETGSNLFEEKSYNL
jgi:predicted  nucleic acid-binding Zn-ribbon protein